MMYVWSMKNDVVPSFVSQGINEFAVPFVFIKPELAYVVAIIQIKDGWRVTKTRESAVVSSRRGLCRQR